MEEKNRGGKLLPILIAGATGLVVQELSGIKGALSLAVFIVAFVATTFISETFLYGKDGPNKKKTWIGVLVFVLLVAFYSYLKVKRQYIF